MINYDNVKTLYTNGNQVKTLFRNGREIRLSCTVSFNTNMSNYYYISGQGGAATTVTVPSATVPIGAAIGTLPSVGNQTYTLSGVSYTVYILGWYLESTLTTQVTASWVPAGDTTLYAKWKMTANVAISASITVPKFATSVSWSCSSNSASRAAVSQSSGSSKGAVALVMAAPTAGKNSDNYTWTGAIGGKALTLASQSLKLNGVTRSVSTPASAATAKGTYNVWSAGLNAISVTVFNSNSLKCVVSRSKVTGSGTFHFTATWYYGSSTLGSQYIADVRYTEKDGDILPAAITDTYKTAYWTFSSTGSYGRSACSSGSSYTASIAAVTGTGYTRSVSVNA